MCQLSLLPLGSDRYRNRNRRFSTKYVLYCSVPRMHGNRGHGLRASRTQPTLFTQFFRRFWAEAVSKGHSAFRCPRFRHRKQRPSCRHFSRSASVSKATRAGTGEGLRRLGLPVLRAELAAGERGAGEGEREEAGEPDADAEGEPVRMTPRSMGSGSRARDCRPGSLP